MNRSPIIVCLLLGFAFVCPAANGQRASDHPKVPAPVNPHGHSQMATHGTVQIGVESVSAVEVIQSPPANATHWSGSHSHHGHSLNHPGVAHIGAGTPPLQASYSLHRAGENFYCPSSSCTYPTALGSKSKIIGINISRWMSPWTSVLISNWYRVAFNQALSFEQRAIPAKFGIVKKACQNPYS